MVGSSDEELLLKREIEMAMMQIGDVADRWSSEPEVSHRDLRLGKKLCPFPSGDCFKRYASGLKVLLGGSY